MSQRLWVLCGWAVLLGLAVVLMDWKAAVDLRAGQVERLQTNVARLERVAKQADWPARAKDAQAAEDAWLRSLLQAPSMPILKVQLMQTYSSMLQQAAVGGYDVGFSDAPYADARYRIVVVKLSGSFSPNSLYALLSAIDDTTTLRQLESLVIKDRRFELVLRLLSRVDVAGVTP